MTLSTISQLRMLEQDAPGAIEWGERAIALATSLDADDIRAHAMVNVGTALHGRDKRAAREMLEQAFRLAQRIGADDDAVRALTNLGFHAWVHRDLALAERVLERGIAFASERDLTAMELYQRSVLASVWLARGRFEDARVEAGRLAALPAAIAGTQVVALVCQGRAMTILAQDGEAILRQAQELASSIGELQRLGPATAALAEAAWLRGDMAPVLDDVRRVLVAAVDREFTWIAGELALWLHRAGEDIVVPGIPDVFALEIAGEGHAAADLWEQQGLPLEAIRARASTAAADDLRWAIGACDRLGAVADAARVARIMRGMGVRNVPRGPRPQTRSNVAHLTSRELDVLDLLTQGASNREIADRLFLSVKTAGHHVSSILAKLDVSSRGEAVTRAGELGIGKDRESANVK
jgi:DNA-binding CsgD family transcriptional regulator